MVLKLRRRHWGGTRGLCCITLLLAATATINRVLRPGLRLGFGPAAVLSSAQEPEPAQAPEPAQEPEPAQKPEPNGGQMGSLVGMSSVLANLATVGAMLYLVHKLSKMSGGAPPGFATRAAGQVQVPLTPTRPVPQFDRQVSPLGDLGDGVLLVGQQQTVQRTSSVVFTKEGKKDLTIKDSPDALMAMKAVFTRLCTSSSETLSVADVRKVHELLGEPVDDAESKEMLEFFGAKSDDASVVDFDEFMRWWSSLHDGSADPDDYYSKERYRQRFKVLQSRLKEPNIANIASVPDGDISSRRYRVYFEQDGHRLSPWHDVPLQNPDGSYNFVCEIPKWTRKKFEIATGEPMNPIKQDVKNGVLREYKWGDMCFNYGAFPQTWEDPKTVSEETGCPGDNDPVDVIEIGTRQRMTGSITRVKILGLIAMIDADETDWKILAIALDDDKAPNIGDLNDIDAHMPGATGALTHWLRMYKTAEGKGENRFGCGEKPMGAAFATHIVQETHEAWRRLLASKKQTGNMKRTASGTELVLDGED